VRWGWGEGRGRRDRNAPAPPGAPADKQATGPKRAKSDKKKGGRGAQADERDNAHHRAKKCRRGGDDQGHRRALQEVWGRGTGGQERGGGCDGGGLGGGRRVRGSQWGGGGSGAGRGGDWAGEGRGGGGEPAPQTNHERARPYGKHREAGRMKRAAVLDSRQTGGGWGEI